MYIRFYKALSVYLHGYVWYELLCDYKCVPVGIRSEVIIASQTVTMTGANSTREMSITSSLTVTMTGANSSLNDLSVAFIAIAAVVAVLLVVSMIVIGVLIYRHKRVSNAHNGPGPRYVFLWLAV